MRHALHGALGGLVLGIVAGALPLRAVAPLPAQQLQALKAQEPQRKLQALSQARALTAQLGFQAGESLAVKGAFTNAQGRTVVRFNQTYSGYRVYGSGCIGHLEANGQLKLISGGARANAIPDGTPTLSSEQAIAIGLKHAGLKGKPFTPKVEQVVFPTRLTDGLKVAYDPSTKKFSLDRTYSVVGGRPSEPYVWAYQVDVFTQNNLDGVTDLRLIIDAKTGAVLKKLNNLHTQAAPEVVLPGTPAQGFGLGQYCGQVTVDVTKAADGTFALRDSTRGTLPNPFFLEAMNLTLTGITTTYEMHPVENGWPTMEWGSMAFYQGKPGGFDWDGNLTGNSAAWGDGYPFADAPHEGDLNGETAAVDAHWGLGQTWDMYRNVFGHEGLDGQGTTPFAMVHMRNPQNGYKFDNAMWSNNMYGMFFGDGTYYPDTLMMDDNGNMAPGNPAGMMSLTEIDTAGHELSHGLTYSTAGLIYQGESGGLNEAASDIMGTLVEAYTHRKAGEDSTIPSTGTDWVMGAKTRPSGPLRFMKKPSKDYLSADNWYEGLDWLEVHYSSGPMNRCFYFLSEGAPASSSDEAYSPYTPAGTDGIGLDKAGHVFFKALTEYMGETTTYHEAGAAMVQAAMDLYPDDPAVIAGVKNALKAINIQVEGEPLLTRVTMPVVNADGELGGNPGNWVSKLQIVPMAATVALRADVLNATDKSVTWKVGGHRAAMYSPLYDGLEYLGGGVVNADGTWQAPIRKGFFLMTAFSKAQPEQFAEGIFYVPDLDADGDTEQDAMDMGASAFSWFLSYPLKDSHSVSGNPVDDLDANIYQAAIKTAWGAK